jgi:hypothetical protein
MRAPHTETRKKVSTCLDGTGVQKRASWGMLVGRGEALAGALRDGALLNSHAFEPPRSAQNGEGGAVCGANCQFDCKKRIITGSFRAHPSADAGPSNPRNTVGSVCGARMFNNYDKEVCVGMSSFRIIFFVATRLKKIIGALSIEIPARNPKISFKKIFNRIYHLQRSIPRRIFVHRDFGPFEGTCRPRWSAISDKVR